MAPTTYLRIHLCSSTSRPPKSSPRHSSTAIMSPKQDSKHHSHTSTSSSSSSSSSSSTSSSSSASAYYQYLPSLDATSWAAASNCTVIDDDDLSFDGKSLSEWYEEDRMRLSRSASEEECRGRRRYRQ